MVLGMSLSTFTALHVLISLIGIGSGVVVVYGFLRAKKLNGITAIFLSSTALTSLTGFLFPVQHLMPSHIVGILSLVVLAIAAIARYPQRMQRSWRWIYVAGAMAGFYFNTFVLVAQSFMKVPALHALAPTQKEPPFAVAQLGVLALFIVLGYFAVKRFQLEPSIVPSQRSRQAA